MESGVPSVGVGPLPTVLPNRQKEESVEGPCRVARCSPRLWGRGARAKVLKTASQVELRKSRRVERVNSMASRCRSRHSRIREVGLALAARQKRT